MLADAAAFVQLDATFGALARLMDRTSRVAETARHPVPWWCRRRTPRTARGRILRRPAIAGACRQAGLVFNRTHPMPCALPIERAIDAAETLDETTDSDATSLVAAVLRIHAERGQTANGRSGCCPGSPVKWHENEPRLAVPSSCHGA